MQSNMCACVCCLFVCLFVCLYFKRMLNNQNKMLPTAVSVQNIKDDNRLLLLLLLVFSIFVFAKYILFSFVLFLLLLLLLLEKFHMISVLLPLCFATFLNIHTKEKESFKEFLRFICTIRLNDDDDNDDTSNHLNMWGNFI